MSYQAQEVEQLNRRIATEVMGEPEPGFPEWTEEVAYQYDTGTPSEGGNWHVSRFTGHLGPPPIWQPLNFSRDMDLAIRAVDKVLNNLPVDRQRWLRLEYGAPLVEWEATIIDGSGHHVYAGGAAHTAPEAIVRCLLEFVEGAE